MKKILIIILFSLIIFPFSAIAENLNYTNQQNHYSFTLPSGWVEIPKTKIDEAVQSVSDQTGTQSIDIITGFQLENVPDFQYPYIMIQEYKVDTPSYNDVMKKFESAEFSETANKTIDEYSELMTNTSIENPFIDKKRNIIFMNIESEVANIGNIKGLMALFLGKESITQLIFYSLESDYSQNLAIFNQIIDTFEYAPGYEYDEEKVKNNVSPSIFDGIIEAGVSGAINGVFIILFVGIIILIYKFFSRLKRKK